MAREWDYFSGIESMTHCMPRENRSVRRALVFSVALTNLAGSRGSSVDGPRARFGVSETASETR